MLTPTHSRRQTSRRSTYVYYLEPEAPAEEVEDELAYRFGLTAVRVRKCTDGEKHTLFRCAWSQVDLLRREAERNPRLRCEVWRRPKGRKDRRPCRFDPERAFTGMRRAQEKRGTKRELRQPTTTQLQLFPEAAP